MRVIGNILWFILYGLWAGLLWSVSGVLCCITIIGIPLGIQCFKIAGFVFWPFGRDISYTNMGFSSVLGNILWIILFGWGLALSSLLAGAILCVTLIGIPFGLQCFKLVKISFIPFGAEIIKKA